MRRQSLLRRELMGNCSPTDAEARLRARRLPLQSAHGTDSVHATTQQEEKLIPTYTTDPPGNELVPSKKPLVTWALMFLSLVSVLLIPDWTNSGSTRPMRILAVPVMLSLAGAYFAAQAGHFRWAMIAAFWGFVLVQGIIVAVTLIGGP